MIHPDKLPRYQQATKAFQALVRAFEVLTSPEPPPEATAAAKARAYMKNKADMAGQRGPRG